MKYIDRKGNMTVEENSQDRLLRHLYHDRGGKLCLKLLVRPFVSKAAGVFLNTPFSRFMIPGFVKRNGIDLRDYTKRNFTSYNDFFTRKIKKGLRPIAEGENLLVSPCDAKATVCRIGKGEKFYIKDTEYTLEQLLKSKKLGERYLGGYAVILRLTVDDYHHYCYPAEGVQSPVKKISGVFHTVNPTANDAFPIYRENAREYVLLKTEKFGTILMMEVGAMMVGKITNLYTGKTYVRKGQEKGYFEFGGSTVILLLQNEGVRIDSDLLENSEEGYETILRMGERIGECKLSKRTGKIN